MYLYSYKILKKIKNMYNTNVNVQDHETLHKANIYTGELKEIKRRPNNIPKGQSRLKYENFTILNQKVGKALEDLGLSALEKSVVYHMVDISRYGSNSLEPLSDDLSLREKGEVLNIGKDAVIKITNHLFKIGVFLSIQIYTDSEKKYWVLNPYISWKGKLVQDSLFLHFEDCTISKLLK